MFIQFELFGKPATQGSKRALPVGKGANRRHIVVDSCKGLIPWRHYVAAEAAKVYDGPLLEGPVMLAVTFDRVRPKSHFGTGKNADVVKDSAPSEPTGKPDSLKQVRAIEDAMSGVIYRDDSQIVKHSICKRWGPKEKTQVMVTTQ